MDDALFERLLAAYRQTVNILDPIRFAFYNERGLTMAQARVLFILAERGDRPAGDLAQELQVSPSTVTGMTDRLIKQGLIVRKEDSRDRRVVLLALSEDGVRLTSEVAETAKSHLRKVFANISGGRLTEIAAALEDLGNADIALRASSEATSSPA